jgi:hypothetical protein
VCSRSAAAPGLLSSVVGVVEVGPAVGVLLRALVAVRRDAVGALESAGPGAAGYRA